jgi:hypothetical protein
LYLLDWKPLVTSAIWGSDPVVPNSIYCTLTQERGGRTREKVRGPIVHKAGSKIPI